MYFKVTEISRNDVPDYLYYMERAGMIMQLRTATQGIRELGKVEKVYLENTNLMAMLVEKQPEKDDIEFGYSDVIPLWAFGLNY